MLKGLANIAQMMKQAQQFQGKMGEIQERLARLHVEGTAGGGMVTVTANGQQKVTSCRIDETVFQSGDREMIEELLVSAVNQAMEKSKAATAEAMTGAMQGMEFPGLDEAMSNLGMGGGAT